MADACHGPSFLKKVTELPILTLPLPSSFVKAHGTLLRSDVILEGPSRKLWRVAVDGVSSPSSNVMFGKGWEEFVVAHVLQLGDQLCFTLTANSHFQVEVYDESGCQKTSALHATGSHASAPMRLPELQIPPISESDSAATRVSQIQNLDDDPTLNLATFNNKAGGKRPLSDIPSVPRRSSAFQNPKSDAATATRRQSQIQNLSDDPTLHLAMFNNEAGQENPLRSDLRRDSALAIIRRDSARKGSAVRDPYVLSLPTTRTLIPDSLLDLADCFVDMEKILSELPDLTDTEPLLIEDIPPCWELHDGENHTRPLDLASSTTSSSEETSSARRRISTLFANRPPDLRLQIPTTSGVSKIGNREPTTGQNTPKQREPLLLRRPSALQIPTVVLESEEESPSSTKTPMRLSQIQNLDDPTLKAEELALYTKVAAEKALSELQFESAAGSPVSRRESSEFKAQSFSI